MQVTLKDIAKKSGYSVTTVSRALAGYTDVNEDTRRHITTIADTLGYQPNLLARQLRSQRTQTLGLIIPSADNSISNEFFSQLLLGIGDAASRAGYDLLVSAHVPGEPEMAAYRRIIGGNRVDGMILARTRQNDERIAYLQSLDHPFVVNGRGAPGERNDFPFIDVDSQTGIASAVAHLVELGHTHIGLILPPPEMAFTGFRHLGYRDGLSAAGLPYRADYVTHGDLQRSGGFAQANALLDAYPDLTAIVASNDLMALGALSAVQARGLQVGIDISVTGFDGIPAAEYAHPPLTTLHQPIYEIGRRLVALLNHLILGSAPEEPQTQSLLSSTLIVRASTGRNTKGGV
ncbi:MAG: LacI family DNA-binding transcriptional regulator [Chloroflexota bacterium]